MENIKCPKCGEIFTVDESTYSKLLNEIKNVEFEKELHEKLNNLKEMQEVESKLAIKEISEKKEKEINDLKAQLLKVESNLALNAKDNEVAIKDALAKQQSSIEEKNREIEELNKALKNLEIEAKKDKENALNKAKSDEELNSIKISEKYKEEIASLKEIIAKNEINTKLEVNNAKTNMQELLNKKENEISDLNYKLTLKDNEKELALEKSKAELNELLKKKEMEFNSFKEASNEKIDALNQVHELEKKQLTDQVNYFKDLKTKMSTKLVGETLEQHCLIEFNKIRALIPGVYFEKDNDSKTGSKGDFIYRENDGDTEVLSIMFEMKNEMDTTESKHKNEHFFKELDKDRKEKNCEYAVLVSMLEADNDAYNAGITNVYQYEKMYVVRPQCFTAIITLLRDLALKTISSKHALAEAKKENADLTQFEANLNKFKEAFAKNFNAASNHFNSTIAEIDKAIKTLEKTKEELLGVNKQLGFANDKAQDITIRKLTKDAPSVKEALDEIRKNNQ